MAITRSDITALDTEIASATTALDNLIRRADMIAADEHSPRASQVSLNAKAANYWLGNTKQALDKLTEEVPT